MYRLQGIVKIWSMLSQKAMDAIVKGAKALAFTALELFENPEELAKVKEDHTWHVEHQKEN